MPSKHGSTVSTAGSTSISIDTPAERPDAVIANRPTARGEPGVWTQYAERYYAAFVNDFHGNNVEAVWHAPGPVTDAPRRSGVP